MLRCFAFQPYIQNRWAVQHGKIIIILSGSKDSNTVFRKLRYFTYLTLSSVTRTTSPLLGIWRTFLSRLNTFFVFFNVFYVFLWFFERFITLVIFSVLAKRLAAKNISKNGRYCLSGGTLNIESCQLLTHCCRCFISVRSFDTALSQSVACNMSTCMQRSRSSDSC